MTELKTTKFNSDDFKINGGVRSSVKQVPNSIVIMGDQVGTKYLSCNNL